MTRRVLDPRQDTAGGIYLLSGRQMIEKHASDSSDKLLRKEGLSQIQRRGLIYLFVCDTVGLANAQFVDAKKYIGASSEDEVKQTWDSLKSESLVWYKKGEAEASPDTVVLLTEEGTAKAGKVIFEVLHTTFEELRHKTANTESEEALTLHDAYLLLKGLSAMHICSEIGGIKELKATVFSSMRK